MDTLNIKIEQFHPAKRPNRDHIEAAEQLKPPECVVIGVIHPAPWSGPQVNTGKKIRLEVLRKKICQLSAF